MGGGSSKQKNLMIDIMNKSIFNSINKNTTECQNELSAIQNITIISTATEEQQEIFQKNKLECQQLFKDRSTEDIKELCPQAMVEVSDINQDMAISFKGKCELNAKQINDIKTNIINEVSQKLKEEKDELTGALRDITGAFSKGDDEDINIEQTVKNIVETNITNENLTKTVTEFTTSQTLNFEGNGGTLKASAITQKASYTIIMGNITNQLAKNVSETVAQTTAKQDADIKEKGITDIATTAIKTFGNLLSGPFMIIAGIVGVGLLLVILSRGRKVKNAPQMVQQPMYQQPMYQQPMYGRGPKFLFPSNLNKKIRIDFTTIIIFSVSIIFISYSIKKRLM